VLRELARGLAWVLVLACRLALLALHVLASSVVQAAAGLVRGVWRDCRELRSAARDPSGAGGWTAGSLQRRLPASGLVNDPAPRQPSLDDIR